MNPKKCSKPDCNYQAPTRIAFVFMVALALTVVFAFWSASAGQLNIMLLWLILSCCFLILIIVSVKAEKIFTEPFDLDKYGPDDIVKVLPLATSFGPGDPPHIETVVMVEKKEPKK